MGVTLKFPEAEGQADGGTGKQRNIASIEAVLRLADLTRKQQAINADEQVRVTRWKKQRKIK